MGIILPVCVGPILLQLLLAEIAAYERYTVGYVKVEPPTTAVVVAGVCGIMELILPLQVRDTGQYISCTLLA